MSVKREYQTPSLVLELALLCLLALLWGASYALIKVAVATITPVFLVAVRVAIAAILLWFVAWLRGWKFPRSPSVWGGFFIQSAVNSILPFTMIAWGQQFVDSSLAGILNSTSPIFVFLFTVLWTRHEPIGPGKLAGVIAGLGGVVTIIGVEAIGGLGTHVAGQFAIVLATACYGVAAIYGQRFKSIPPEVTAAGTMTWAAAVLLPTSFLVESPLGLEPSRDSVIALGLLAVFGTAGAFVLYFRLVNTIGSMGTASVAYLRAGVSVVLGIAFLNEPFSWTLGLGLVAVVFGVAAINGQFNALWPAVRSWFCGSHKGGGL